MYSKTLKIFLVAVTFLFLACDDPEETSRSTTNEEEPTVVLPVQIQVLGSLIEGMIVCDSNNSCKKTDADGVVSFDEFGDYAFKIKDINVSVVSIETNMTLVSPYTFFENNETLAKNFLLLLHAFDKGSDITDEKVSLTFSSYIPIATSIKTFIEEKLDGEDLVYSANDHNVIIDTEDNSIERDGVDDTIDVPAKEVYAKLDNVSNFITLANDRNVTLGNVSTNYLLSKTTPTSFTLGERYSFKAYAKAEDIVVDIYDSTTRSKDSAKLVIDDDNNTFITNLVSITLVD